MGTYYGKISGIGNPTERINEITADDLATLRYFQIGLDYGVLNREGYNFSIKYEINTSSVEVGKGIMFAYGYLGYIDKCVLEFIRPAISQYHIIYVELDRSKIPNICTLKVKNNQSSTSIERTFRQDYLDKVRTGVFQLPLWRVKVGSNGIEEVVDLRKLYDKPKQVQYSINTKRVVGKIDSGVTAVTQPNNDNSNKIATTMFVHNATRDYIDNNLIQITLGGELSEALGTAYIEVFSDYTFAIGDILTYNKEQAKITEYDGDMYTLRVITNGEFYKKQYETILVSVSA